MFSASSTSPSTVHASPDRRSHASAARSCARAIDRLLFDRFRYEFASDAQLGRSSWPHAISSSTRPRARSVSFVALSVSMRPSTPHAAADPDWQRRSASACSGRAAKPP
jgi:hypothetical protein